MTRAAENQPRRSVGHVPFALTLLAVAGIAGVAAASVIPTGPRPSLPAEGSNRTTRLTRSLQMGVPLAHARASTGMRALLRPHSFERTDGEVIPECLPPYLRGPYMPKHDELLGNARSTYRENLQRVLVEMLRDSLVHASDDTQNVFASARRIDVRHVELHISRKDETGWLPLTKVPAPYGLIFHLRPRRGQLRLFALTLSTRAPALLSPIKPFEGDARCKQQYLYSTFGPTFWDERWALAESGFRKDDRVQFVSKKATLMPWLFDFRPAHRSPWMQDAVGLLLDTVIDAQAPERSARSDDSLKTRLRMISVASAASTLNALAPRMAASGFDCLLAVSARQGLLHRDALELLKYLWHTSWSPVSRHPTTLPALVLDGIPSETVRDVLGVAVQWSIPRNVYVEYRPDLRQRNVLVFMLGDTLYGARVDVAQENGGELRPLDTLRGDLGPQELCRRKREIGSDVDGMCIEWHVERDGSVTVTQQGVTVTQQARQPGLPPVRLRVAVNSQSFQGPDGQRRFFAFGRLGELDAHGVAHVSPNSPLVDMAQFPETLTGNLTRFEQASTDGPIAGRRIQLRLQHMLVSVPFGTYGHPSSALQGVVQLSHEVYYHFTLPQQDAEPESHQIQLRRGLAHDSDTRRYWLEQRHRALEGNATLLPAFSFGETRTLLRLYLRHLELAPSPADVWRGFEEISLSVPETRQAIAQLTQRIEQRARPSMACTSEHSDIPAPSSPTTMPISPELLPILNRVWSRWQSYPEQVDAFIIAISNDFVSGHEALAIWSPLPFTGDVNEARHVLSLFEEVTPGMSGLASLVTGRAQASRAVQRRMREVSGGANIAVAEVVLTDGTRTIYYCLSGLQHSPLPTNTPTVRFVDAGQAYMGRDGNVIAQVASPSGAQSASAMTESPRLNAAMGDADLPTYHRDSNGAKSRTLDTERLILAQIYADHPAGRSVVRSIVLCSRMSFCDSCAVNLAMVPYHYPDAELRFYFIAESRRDQRWAQPARHNTGHTPHIAATTAASSHRWRSNAERYALH